jgi:hypothetical protein
MKHPDAVISPAERSGASQTTYGGRHRRPMRPDQIRKPLMRQRQWNGNAFRNDPSPAFGQVPERQQQTVVNALMMGDRQGDGQRMRATSASRKKLHTEFRPRSHPADEAMIEDGQLRPLKYQPPDLGMNMRAIRVPPPRTQDVARAEQLDASPAEHLDLAREKPVDDQKASMVHIRLHRARRVPLTPREPTHSRQRLAPRPVTFRLLEQISEIRVRIHDADEICSRTHAELSASLAVQTCANPTREKRSSNLAD